MLHAFLRLAATVLFISAAIAGLTAVFDQFLPDTPTPFLAGLGTLTLFVLYIIYEGLKRVFGIRITVRWPFNWPAKWLNQRRKKNPLAGDSSTPPIEERMVEMLIEQITISQQDEALKAHKDLEISEKERMLEMVRDAVKSDQIDLYIQPIVRLPQRKIEYYECLAKLRTTDGTLLDREEYRPYAEEADVITAIDNLLLIRTLVLLRQTYRRQPKALFFCGISRHTITNDEYFFTDFINYLQQNQNFTKRLVFQITQADFAEMQYSRNVNLLRLLGIGAKFAISEVTNFQLDLDKLDRHRIKYINIRAENLLTMAHDKEKPIDINQVNKNLDREAIDMIVSKIDEEPTLLEILDFSVPYGQGNIFGPPKPSLT